MSKKALEKQKAKRKQKHQLSQVPAPASLQTILPLAANWPVSECLISRDWQKSGDIVQVVVAREAPYGKLAVAAFVVDLGCLGVKNSLVKTFPTWADYKVTLRDSLTDMQAIVTADFNLVAKIINTAVEWAAQFGFKPAPGFAQASLLLKGADLEALPEVTVPTGRGGQPLFIAGPHDNVPLILAKLDKAVGPGNYLYVAFAAEPAALPEIE